MAELTTELFAYKPDYEYSVIGAICIDPHVIDEIIPVVKSSDFMMPTCRKVFETALNARNSGNAFDPIIAADVISCDIPDAKEFIASCMTLTPTLRNAVAHAKIIHKSAEERKLSEAIRELIDTKTGDELAVELGAVCQEYLSGKLGKTHTMSEVMQKLCDSLVEPPKNRLYTGHVMLDKTLNGIREGNMVIIAARPGVGKSALTMDFARAIALKGKKCLYYSYEMSEEENGERWLAMDSNVSLQGITSHNLGELEWGKITDSMSRLSALPILICDDPTMTTERIRAQARTTADVGAIFVDYLGLMKSEGRKSETRNLEIGQISRELKLLAMELKIPVFVVAQLNRNVSDTQKPTLADLRDSGEIEQNANTVIFIWNADKENGIIGVSVDKNRQGSTGEIRMKFDKEYMRFREIETEKTDTSETQRKRRGRY